ncbi:retrovirus-related Pol polyprotein from transposon 297 [Trichonephila inaurata madagascariensis]|uniref:Retrovirus-related Pol polyprotein from transposon 297 n=1 Tax=Trichonephila inaurata madagascariensis TaxID=2747483 RepID=A0A8X6YS08_9ARAC|nr:retrovirus-related Pol polyprotein from transposon 297 [Trichonephila inaurata madagascariensis]
MKRKEMAILEENLAEDIENLLPSFTEEHYSGLININTDELMKPNRKVKKLAPLIQKRTKPVEPFGEFGFEYIPMFSVSTPLTELLKEKSKKGYINWTSGMSRILFVQLKEKLSTNPVLYAPDFKRQFILQTVASDTGIKIVLAQRNDRGEEHPILYLSKKFSDAEKVYCTSEKECAAVVYAVNCYLDEQQKFIIQTDHNPLVWLKTNAGTNPCLMRWSLALQPFNFEVIHKPGRSHANADALSRID